MHWLHMHAAVQWRYFFSGGLRAGSDWSTGINGQSGVVQLSAGWSHTCSLDEYGTVQCSSECLLHLPGITLLVGVRRQGTRTFLFPRIGCRSYLCHADSYWSAENEIPSDLPSVAQITTGQDHNCALLKAGTVVCWGACRGAVQLYELHR